MLHPPVTGSTGGPRDVEALLEGPCWVRSRNGTRWHRPRSGVVYPAACWSPEPYTAWSLWCGQSAFDHRVIGRDEIPDDGVPCCGTCEGRAVGAGYPALLGDPLAPTIFSPHGLTPPKRCPGSRSWPHQRQGRIGTCDVCGETLALRGGGGAYAPTDGLVNHAPGPGLVMGCEFHAWRRLVIRESDARVVCRCEVPMGDGWRFIS